jgi:hypothetical protein
MQDGLNAVLKYDGTSISTTGFQYNGYGYVNDLEIYDNELYACGTLQQINDPNLEGVLKYTGSSWVNVGAIIPSQLGVYCLEVFNNELYAGGSFLSFGSTTASCIARYNGTSWNTLGTGTNNVVYDLTKFDNDLIVGGYFQIANGVSINNSIAKWDGTSFSNLTTSGGFIEQYTLNSDGCNLYSFGHGLPPIQGIYRWDNNSWNNISTTWIAGIYYQEKLEVLNNDLYACGSFSNITTGVPAENFAKYCLGSNSTPVVASNQTICSGNSVSLNVSNYFGNIQWQSSNSSGGPWTNISGATNANYSTSTLNNTTFYQVQLTSGLCNAVSNVVQITVNQTPTVTISVNGNNPFCEGTPPPILVASAIPNIVSYQWQYYNNSWLNIAGATNSTYLPAEGPGLWNYQVIVTNNSEGCTASANDWVEELANPADFTFDNENCEDQYTCFHFQPIAGQSPLWDFGDGTTSSGQVGTNICHSYTDPGIYTVTLTVTNTNNNCVRTISNIVIVNPSTTSYNQNCCSFNFTYALYDTDVNPPGGTETWSANGDPTSINGTITVKSGKILNIDHWNIVLGINGKFVVEPGATLIVNHSILEGFLIDNDPPLCSAMWHGIEVWGDPAKTHQTTYGAPFQGKVIISDNSIIRDAHNAVVLGKPSGGGFDFAYSGGIIDASNSTFRNNGADIRFAPYYHINSGKIISCTFESVYNNNTTIPLYDPGYELGNSYTYPNASFPFYAPANAIRRTAFGINAWGVRHVLIDQNTFTNLEVCIQIYDSQLRIFGNTFNNNFAKSTCGIRINSMGAPYFNGNYISGNTFSNVLYHIIDVGGKYDNVSASPAYGPNLFGSSSSSQSDNLIGIALFSAQGFNITDNDFQKLSIGVYPINSDPIGGNISYQSSGNDFTNCGRAIFSIWNNSHLNIHCNNFMTPNYPLFYNNFSWQLLGPLANQGVFTIGSTAADVKLPAGDRFFEQQANLLNASVPFYYYRHYASSLSDPVHITAGNVFEVVDPNVQFTSVSAACDPTPCNPPCDYDRIAAINMEIDSLSNILENIQDHIANENTQELLDSIYNGTNATALKQVLSSAAPLSDTVLKALSGTATVLPDDSVKALLIENSTLSVELVDEIINNNTTLDSTAKAEIIAEQGKLAITAAGIQQLIAQKQVTKQLALNDLVRYYADSDSVEAAIDLLIAQNTDWDKQTLFSTYLSYGMIDSAQSVYNDLDAGATVDSDWLTVQGMMLDFVMDSVSVFAIDSAQHVTLYEIADKHEASLATANARSILKLVFNEEFTDDFDEVSLRIISQESHAVPKRYEANVLKKFELIPNPAKDQVTVSYNLPKLSPNAKFEVIDILGQVHVSRKISSASNFFTLSLTELSAGIYLCRIYDENLREEKKLIINK